MRNGFSAEPPRMTDGVPSFLVGGGEIASLMRARDWSTSPLGPLETWPQSLKTVLRLALASQHPMFVWWGPRLIQFYNDAYRQTMGPEKHPAALGGSGHEWWPESWAIFGPQIDSVMNGGPSTWHEDQQIPVRRHGADGPSFWTYSFSAIDDEAAPSGVGGVLAVCRDVTEEHLLRETLAAEREDEHRRRLILESAIDFAIVATDQEGQVTDWNTGAERIFGWSAEEMKGAPADRFFTPEDRAIDRLGTEMRRALTVGRASDERWHLKKDQSRFWASGELMPLKSDAGVHLGFIKILRDLTEDRRVAERHRADAEFTRSILAASNDCISVLDLDARLIFMSDGGRRVMEVSDFGSIHGCPWPGFWKDAGNEQALAAVEAARRGCTGHFQSQGDTMAGTPRWWDVQVTAMLDADGKPEKLLAVSRDITENRRAEEALREAQGLNTLILTSTRDCIVVLDLEGRTQFVSAGAIASMEISDVDSILGLFWLRVWKDDDHAAACAAVAEARAGGTGRFRGFCATHKGTPKWWDVVVSPLFDTEGRPERLVTVGRDITESRQAEIRQVALLELGDRLRETADPAAMAFAAAEILGRTLDIDRAGYGAIDADRETVTIERDWTAPGIASIAGMHRFRDFGSYIDDLKRGETVVFPDTELDRRTAGGAGAFGAIGVRAAVNVPIFERGAFVAVFYLAHGEARPWLSEEIDFLRNLADRTRAAIARRRAEIALQEINATLERRVEDRTRERDQVWQTSRDMLCVANFEGYFLSLNPAWAATLGWTEAEMKAAPAIDFVHPADHPATLKAAAGLKIGEAQLSFENRYRHKDGSYRNFSWNAVPRDGLVYASVRDITSNKEQAETRRLLEEQLRQSQKMEAVGQLTGGLAHDFNNLLTGISGSLELLQTRVAQGRLGEVDRYVAAAQSAASRAAALTHRLLAFSRRQTLDPKPTQANRLVADMEELIRRTMGPEISVETVLAGELWPTLCDPNQLENALLNLCINARDAMPDGGRLTIETANISLVEAEARQRDMIAGEYVVIRVSDSGIGMPPDVVARAFDPFFTTKPLGQGTGLGLSMIYGFAKQSGGQVRIASEIGEGATVGIYLPRHRGEVQEDAAPLHFASPPRAEAGETVLVVDDEPTVRMLVAEVLEELGYAAIEAADGASGLVVLQSDARIDLLITDVGLPGGMNGRQLADAARISRAELKVLFITGYAENAIVGNSQLEPGMQVMIKPFGMDMLATRIKAIINSNS
jgi:PAS domain S-box-containing protein